MACNTIIYYSRAMRPLQVQSLRSFVRSFLKSLSPQLYLYLNFKIAAEHFELTPKRVRVYSSGASTIGS